MIKINETLAELGFEEKEIEVYLAAIEKVPISILELARKTKIKRTSIYNFHDHMIESGLIEKMVVGKRTLYAAAHPKDLPRFLERKMELLSSIIPDLSMLYGKSGSVKPKIRFYEGIEAIKNIYSDIIAKDMEGQLMLYYSNFEEEYKAFSNYFIEVFTERRIERKVRVQGIMSSSAYAEKHTQKNKRELRESITLPAEEFPIYSTVIIYNNKIAIISFGDERVGIVVESKHIADTQRSIFNLAWHGLLVRKKGKKE